MKEILLNRLYVGKFLNENIGHEVINLFKADDDKNYVYINHTGKLGAGHNEIENILLVQGINYKTLEIIAKAKVVQSVWDMPDEERIKKQRQVTYDGVTLKEIFNQGDDYPYISYEVENVFYPTQKTYITIDENFNQSTGYIVLLPNSNNAIKKLAGQSLHFFFAEKGDKSEVYKVVDNLINDESKWKTENRTQKISVNEYKENMKNNELEVDDFNFLKLIKKVDDELSYSNMFQYFLSKDKKLFEKFMSEILKVETQGDYSIGREVKNIDLLIEDENNIIVIENKIKSGINGIRHDIYSDKIQSQLAEYYEYAKEKAKEKDKKVKCFIFSPDYNKLDLQDYNQSENYIIINYSKLFEFFYKNKINDKYYNDFLSALKIHTFKSNYEIMLENFITQIINASK
ncbi:MAG: PD-(D/E)XK nuclease family protein [Neisseriaceae bacterium]|nr:PD-(D/E)XK nuclease family protein [Neisseriaceae bacterium]